MLHQQKFVMIAVGTFTIAVNVALIARMNNFLPLPVGHWDFNQGVIKMLKGSKKLVLIAMLVLSCNVYATSKDNDIQNGQVNKADANSLAISGSSAVSGSISGAVGLGGSAYANGGSVGNTSVNVDTGNDRIIPVSSAIAPNVNTSVICPIISPTSHAVQFLVFGGSTTGSQTLNGICVAYHLGQTNVVEKIACNTNAEYRKANANCGK